MKKTWVRNMGLFPAFLIIALLGLMAFVRLAPTDAKAWHVGVPQQGEWDMVVPQTGGATLRLALAKGEPRALLARLDTIAQETPRTTRLAGSVEEGRITWETRSALWGFPDYTTAEAKEDGLYVFARLRFGREDMGVNAKRLSDWLARL